MGSEDANPCRVICEKRIWQKNPIEHVHDYAQLILPVHGALSISVEGTLDKTIQNEVVFVPPRAVHTFSSYEKGNVIAFDIQEDWNSQWQNVKGFTREIDRTWMALRTLIEHELTNGTRHSLQLEKLGDYAVHLLALSEPQSIRYIRENFRDSLKVSFLAAMENFSVGHYHKWFIRHTGATPVEYIQRLRIERAKELLRTSDLSIHHIAWDVGYTNQATLSRLFAGDIGLSPVAYRSKMRESVKN
ncbi:MAG: helix-turn-helix domain-containing protein [Negativicutes bacterium]